MDTSCQTVSTALNIFPSASTLTLTSQTVSWAGELCCTCDLTPQKREKPTLRSRGFLVVFPIQFRPLIRGMFLPRFSIQQPRGGVRQTTRSTIEHFCQCIYVQMWVQFHALDKSGLRCASPAHYAQNIFLNVFSLKPSAGSDQNPR